MFFLNLTAGEFFALLGTLGGVVTALYLLDRRVRKKVVSTLRFWPVANVADQRTSRKRMQQPWSLLLQLISLTLLLLAIAQLQWGTRAGRSRDHVILLDTSVWSGAGAPDGTVLEAERRSAARYLGSVPAHDRVMLVRVDALTLPATPFTSNRAQVLSAIQESTSGFSVLDLGKAFAFAQEAQNWSGGAAGEVVYIGPRRTETEQPAIRVPANLRVLSVPVEGENAGIRKVSVRRGEQDANSWDAIVTLRNDGASPRRLTLRTQYAGTRFSPRTYALRPGEELETKYTFVTNTAGRLIAEIDGKDSLPSDNRAELELEGSTGVTVAAYTTRRDSLRPVLEANHHLKVEYFNPSQYSPKPAADLIVLDGFDPREKPAIPSLWIHPPRDGSPLPVNAVVKDAAIKSWHTETLLETSLRGRTDRIGEAEVFADVRGAVPIASIAEGTVIAALNGSAPQPKVAVIGFDPLTGPLRFTVTTPLLFAHLLHWLTPEAFRSSDFIASRVGAVALPLAAEELPDQLRVTDSSGLALPFTIREQTLGLFISKPTIVHIASGENHRRTLSFTLPDVGTGTWKLPSSVPSDLPRFASALPTSVDLWKWLACLGGLGLLAEWLIYGRSHRKIARRSSTGSSVSPNTVLPRQERELVSK